MLKLEYNVHLDRLLRMDDMETIGKSTYSMIEDAIADGRIEDALRLLPYYLKELQIMHDILMTWSQDIMRYLIRHETGVENSRADILSTVICKTWRDFELGVAPMAQVERAIRSNKQAEANQALDRIWLEFKVPHDVLVAWINEMFAHLAQDAEQHILDSILETHQSIWGDRYVKWDLMTPWEKVALTVEGMRGHLSGESRKGDVLVQEEADRFVISFDPCGTGGVLRRGDPDTGRQPYQTDGMNQEPHDWIWEKKTGVHWYCSHCAIAMEWLPGNQRGYVFRPLDHNLDHHAPCVWYVYKDEKKARAYHYPRSGLEIPLEATR
ncbi:hypothetical protein KFU94_03020 [Chloroflexi bacterium TSY]|nr:hypothetical protein [Chloroflexi bacterium TSY]